MNLKNYDDLYSNGSNHQNIEIYSHQSSQVLECDKVAFKHIENYPDIDSNCTDDDDKDDMVYYPKDDMTAYS